MARSKNYPPLSPHLYRVHELPSAAYLRKAEFNWGRFFPFIGPSGIAYAPHALVKTAGGPPATFCASKSWGKDLYRDVPPDEADTATMYLNDAMEHGGPSLLLTYESGWRCYCEDSAHKIAQYLWHRNLVLQGPTATRGGITGLSSLQWKQLSVLVDAVPATHWYGFEVNGNASFDEESWWVSADARDVENLWSNEVYEDATDVEFVESVGPGEFHVVTRVTKWASRKPVNGTVVRLEDQGEELWIVRDVEWDPPLPSASTEYFTKKQAQAIYRNGAYFATSDIPRPHHWPDGKALIKSLHESGNADDEKTAEKLERLRSLSTWDAEHIWAEAIELAGAGFEYARRFTDESGDGEPLYVLTQRPDREAPAVRDYASTPGEDEDLNR